MRLLVPVLVAAVLSAGGLSAAPVPLPPKFDPPTVTGQATSVQRLIDLAGEFSDSVQPGTSDKMKKNFDDLLGPDGWKGIDAKKPVGMYAYLRPKLETSTVVFMLPVSDEKDALATLGKLGFVIEADDVRKGLYAVGNKSILGQDKKVHMRFHDGHACLALNADPDEFSTDKLPPARAIADADEKAPLAVTLHLTRAPKELKEKLTGWWASGRAGVVQMEGNAGGGGGGMPKAFPPLLKAGLGWLDESTTAVFADADTFTLRLKPVPKSLEVGFEFTVVPREKTELAKTIAAMKPAPGRFHQLATKDTVGAMNLTAGPGLNKEVRATLGTFAAEMIERNAMSDELKPIFLEVGRVLESGLKDGKADFGFALLGPDKAGTHTLIAAIGCDPTAIDKAVRKVLEDAPKEVKDLVKFDAEKAGDLSVHTLNPSTAGEWTDKTFGAKPTLRWAVGKDAVYVAFGPDGLAEIKRAAALKPADCKRFDVVASPDKMAKFSGGGSSLEMLMGRGEAVRSVLGINVAGGKELRVTYTQSGLGMFGSVFGGFAFSAFGR